MKVFVSYKRDHKESERLLSLLETELSKPFATVRSDRLLPSGEWRRELLENEIRAALRPGASKREIDAAAERLLSLAA